MSNRNTYQCGICKIKDSFNYLLQILLEQFENNVIIGHLCDLMSQIVYKEISESFTSFSLYDIPKLQSVRYQILNIT